MSNSKCPTHSDQLRKRGRRHLAHDLPAMVLQGNDADVQIAADCLFMRPAAISASLSMGFVSESTHCPQLQI
jgi:hypothetical protein